MFFKECENLAKKHRELKLLAVKIDDYFRRNPTTALDVVKLNNFLKVDASVLENSLFYLNDQGMLTQSVAYVCQNCGGYNELEEGEFLDNDISTCLHCDSDPFISSGKTFIFRLRDSYKEHLASTTKLKKIIIFIHGLGGSPLDTWKNFPDLLQNDQIIKKSYDVDCFTYPTGWGRNLIPWKKGNPEIMILADCLATTISNKYSGYDEIALICHSLGGIIAKKYIVESLKAKRAIKISKLLLYAVPNLGSDLAAIKKLVPWGHTQIKQLCKSSEFLNQLNRDWQASYDDIHKLLNVKYVIGGLDRVVDLNSARSSWGVDSETIANCNHLDIVKPKGADDLTFIIAKNFMVGGIV